MLNYKKQTFGGKVVWPLLAESTRCLFVRVQPNWPNSNLNNLPRRRSPQRSSNVAKAMNRNARSLGPTRENLIKEGMTAPEHGHKLPSPCPCSTNSCGARCRCPENMYSAVNVNGAR